MVLHVPIIANMSLKTMRVLKNINYFFDTYIFIDNLLN